MKFYRFSPIKSERELRDVIEYMHFMGMKMCHKSMGRYLPVAGNIGVFCHYDNEYEYLESLKKELCDMSDNWNQKYFKLKAPITIPTKDNIPETTYDYLYIRKPDPYRHHVGDINYVLPDNEYQELKSKIESGYELPDAHIFPSPRLDMIELHNPDSDFLGYVVTGYMAEKTRYTKSES